MDDDRSKVQNRRTITAVVLVIDDFGNLLLMATTVTLMTKGIIVICVGPVCLVLFVNEVVVEGRNLRHLFDDIGINDSVVSGLRRLEEVVRIRKAEKV